MEMYVLELLKKAPFNGRILVLLAAWNTSLNFQRLS